MHANVGTPCYISIYICYDMYTSIHDYKQHVTGACTYVSVSLCMCVDLSITSNLLTYVYV